MAEQLPAADDGPECDLCGTTSCPDADLPGFSEPRACVLTPVYGELRYDRCEYGCGRDIAKATVRRAARLLAELLVHPALREPDASAVGPDQEPPGGGS